MYLTGVLAKLGGKGSVAGRKKMYEDIRSEKIKLAIKM